MLEKIALPGSNRETTRLGFGCSGLMGGISERESLRLLETAFEAGIRHFDVAPSYGHGQAEGCLGKFLRGKRDQVTVTTKYGILPPARTGLLGVARGIVRPVARRLPAVRRGAAQAAAALKSKARFSVQEARKSLDGSLRHFGVERIDLWLLHEVTAKDLDGSDLLLFLEQMQREGRIGAFGCGTDLGNVAALWQRHPEYCRVLQYEWSCMEQKPDFSGAFRIRHRAISGAIRMIQDSFERDPGLCRRWSDALDVDMSGEETVATLLLGAALVSNPNGIVLFSSRVPGHIQANVCEVGDAASSARSRLLLELLRRYVHDRR
jgi:aryl-alcohol dehydrogenase-like predicted oxidoreductase